jgi:hypothetical protein
MFLGHFAVGFAAKRVAPRTTLTTLMVAATLLDLLWPVFLALGLEHVVIEPTAASPFERLDFTSYPWSHSLLMALVWSVLYALFYRVRRYYTRGALVVGAAVFSHWVLDWVTHLPDLPLIPGGGPRVGLRMWDSPTLTLAVEVPMFLAGLVLYLATTRARSWQGHVSLWSIVVLLALAYYGDVVGPPPPTFQALKTVALIGSLLTLWFVWVDKTRTLRHTRPA